jgi:hypothetical protein
MAPQFLGEQLLDSAPEMLQTLPFISLSEPRELHIAESVKISSGEIVNESERG